MRLIGKKKDREPPTPTCVFPNCQLDPGHEGPHESSNGQRMRGETLVKRSDGTVVSVADLASMASAATAVTGPGYTPAVTGTGSTYTDPVMPRVGDRIVATNMDDATGMVVGIYGGTFPIMMATDDGTELYITPSTWRYETQDDWNSEAVSTLCRHCSGGGTFTVNGVLHACRYCGGEGYAN